MLVGAIRKVSRTRPHIPIRCLFVGTGEHQQEIKEAAFVDDHDAELFRFLGFVEDTREVLWASDVFALPSRLEGFALVVVEAMATGVVPIRTRSGGASDQIIEKKTGLTVLFDDSDSLAAAILMLCDREIRGSMADRCEAHANFRFSASTMVDAMLTVYRGC